MFNCLAIDIGGTAIKYGTVREDYSIESAFEIPTEAHLGGPHLMNKIMCIVDEYAAQVDCVGISTAGQVNSELGKIIFASENIPNYTGIEITKTIQQKHNLPVSVENDVNSAATAEAKFGAGRGYSDFLCGEELPYRDVQMENDGLGLVRTDGRPKPAAMEMAQFRSVVERFSGRMPEPERKTAILVSDLKDDWPGLYNCYILCVQAGLAPKFVRPDRDDLTPYELLLAPSLHGSMPISVPAWKKVADAVEKDIAGREVAVKDALDVGAGHEAGEGADDVG